MKTYKNGQVITFNMDVPLGDLIDAGGIDGLNDIADDNNPANDFMITDISYSVVGFKRGDKKGGTVSGSVIIEVTAVLEEM